MKVATMKQALLVSPEGFKISSESSQDNRYIDISQDLDLSRAHEQHRNVVKKIEELGVPTVVFPGAEGQHDGIFPNNCFATTQGSAIIGRMYHSVRQAESQRKDIREFLTSTLGYKLCDLSQDSFIAELTGVLAIDRTRNIALCGMSQRVDVGGVNAMHEAFGFDLTYTFDLEESEYHTNLVLSVLAGKACVIYPEAVKDPVVAHSIIKAYGDTAVVIDEVEKDHFVGNCISITAQDVLFSQTALDQMTPTTKNALEKRGMRLHGVMIDELEKGGGSLRCLVAEIF